MPGAMIHIIGTAGTNASESKSATSGVLIGNNTANASAVPAHAIRMPRPIMSNAPAPAATTRGYSAMLTESAMRCRCSMMALTAANIPTSRGPPSNASAKMPMRGSTPLPNREK